MYIPTIKYNTIKQSHELSQEIEILGVETVELEDGNYLFNVNYTNSRFMVKMNNGNYVILSKNSDLNEYIVMYKGALALDIINSIESTEVTKVQDFTIHNTKKYKTTDFYNAILTKIFESGRNGNVQMKSEDPDSYVSYYLGVDNKISITRDLVLEVDSIQLGNYIIPDLDKHQLQLIYEDLWNLYKEEK